MRRRSTLLLGLPATLLLASAAAAAPAGSACEALSPSRYVTPVDGVGGVVFETVPDEPMGVGFRERFLAATGNTNRLTLPDAISAHIVDGPRTFAVIDCEHRGIITLEDMRRFLRSGQGHFRRVTLPDAGGA